jgi:predicted transcriptional regulator
MALRNLEKEIDLVLRHIRVLGVLRERGPMGIRRISDETGIPNHQVRYSLRVLEKADALAPTSRGAKLTDGVDEYVKELANKMKELDGRLSEIVDLTQSMAASD